MSIFGSIPSDASKEEAAKVLYGNKLRVWDTALPQWWVDKMLKEHDFDVRPHFVWGYLDVTEGRHDGRPFPVSFEGLVFLTDGGYVR